MRTFEAVTGPKTDRWLVRMVGLLAASIGVSLLQAAKRTELSGEARTLAATSALAFATIDTVYSLRGRISKIYLADAVVEALLLLRML